MPELESCFCAGACFDVHYAGSGLENSKAICLQCRQDSTCPWIPEFDEIVLAARHKETLRWVPLNTLDIPTMPFYITLSRSNGDGAKEVLPVKTLSFRLSSKDQMQTVESSLAVANRPSSGLKLKPRIASR
jgi:hypothetical protein